MIYSLFLFTVYVNLIGFYQSQEKTYKTIHIIDQYHQLLALQISTKESEVS